MIAQRFRPVGWVAGITVVAGAFYMISLHVASERGRLEAIDRKIASTRREIRQLQTEIGTRASMRQLELWNAEALALSAPGEGQFLNGETALASVDEDKLGRSASAPPPVMVAMGANAGAEAEPAKPGLIAMLTGEKPVAKLTEQDRVVQRAIAAPTQVKKPAEAKAAASDASAKPAKSARVEKAAKPEKPARVAMLDRGALTDVARAAAVERIGSSKR